MKIFNLPQDVFPGKIVKPEGIIIHDYSAAVGSFKGKSILQTNAISLVISGEKTMHFAETTVVIKSDEFHFLSAGNCLASMDLSKQKIFRSILIFFDNKVLAGFYLKYASLINKLKGKQKFEAESYISFKKDAFTYNFIESLSLLTQAGSKIQEEMKLLKFEELMLHLLNNYPQKILAFHPTRKNDQEYLEIKKVIESNIMNNISVEELAFLCNMSLSTFKRKFTELYNTSPNKWILLQRMKMAKDLLLHYHEKPSEIYHKVGYENHSSFTQSFKQTYGLTPKDFQLSQAKLK